MKPACRASSRERKRQEDLRQTTRLAKNVGLDVSKEETAFCVKAEGGRVLSRGKAASDAVALSAALTEHCPRPARIVLESGTLAGWLARERRRLGLPVEVIDARRAHAVMRLQHNKTDANDAELLAEIARSGFCRPVAVKSAAAQEDRVLLKARALLVRQRRDAENTIRGLLGSLGLRLPKGAARLAERVRVGLEEHPELSPAIEPLLSAVAALAREIARLDKTLMARAKGDAACRLLMTVPGVGPVTALAYIATWTIRTASPDRVRSGPMSGSPRGAGSRDRWTTRGASRSTATPCCAACSTRPPTAC